MRSVAPRPPWREIFIEKKRRSIQTKRRRVGSPWKLTPLMGIRPPRGFPDSHSGLKTALPTALGFFTVSTDPTASFTLREEGDRSDFA
jgi:hypothetical protein